jgi:uncharacterized membrane protein YjgN (DUF898 family)
MKQLRITCPQCGFSRTVDRQRIPVHAARAVCPRCHQRFPFDLEEERGDRPPTTAAPSAEAVSPPSTRLEPSPAQHSSQRRIPFVFTGNAREYFGIWIVNTLLKIVSFGLYSPWAKVRKRRYFYGNTLLEEAHFDYLADPLALLKGWLIGAVLFILYSIGTRFSPALSGVLGILFFLALPWLVVRSRLFNNRNSSHRNIRFNFTPSYREAYAAFAWLPLLTPFTLGVLAPYTVYRQKRFLMEHNSFGLTPFSFDARTKDFYLVFVRAVGLLLLLGGLSLAAAWVFMPALNGQFASAAAALPMFLPFLFLAGYLFLGMYVYVRLTNLTWNGTRIGGHRFVSSLRVRDMAWLFTSNAFAVALSAGLLMPWATVRLARYRLGHLAIEIRGELDLFRAGNIGEIGAAGEEIGDIFGVDIGI